MDILDWAIIGLLVFLTAYAIAWLNSPEAKATLKRKVRLAASSAILLFGLALTLLFTRLPDPAHFGLPEEEDDDEPEAILYCYHRNMKDFGVRAADPASRRQALERVVPQAAPERRRVPTQPEKHRSKPAPKAAPPKDQPVEYGPSCRLHPRVLHKVLRSIESVERRARDA